MFHSLVKSDSRVDITSATHRTARGAVEEAIREHRLALREDTGAHAWIEDAYQERAACIEQVGDSYEVSVLSRAGNIADGTVQTVDGEFAYTVVL